MSAFTDKIKLNSEGDLRTSIKATIRRMISMLRKCSTKNYCTFSRVYKSDQDEFKRVVYLFCKKHNICCQISNHRCSKNELFIEFSLE